MATEIRVPTLGESVSEATVGQWFKKAGDAVSADEPVVELETDKVTIEVPAPVSGVLGDISVGEGETVEVGALLGAVTEGKGAAPAPAKAEPAPAKAEPAPAKAEKPEADGGDNDFGLSPAVRKLVTEHGLDPSAIKGTGKDGRLLKEDVLKAIEGGSKAPAPAPAAPTAPAVSAEPSARARGPVAQGDEAREERVRMTRLRQTIARRLKDSQNTAAMLTTFNEADMGAVMDLRREYKDAFEKRHGVRLGFMGFFVKACIQALRDVPEVNAEIDGTDIVYKNYYHVGIAVGTDRGLVVPVVREAQNMTLPRIEAEIASLGKRARDGALSIDDMQGGTFTITNGGVYGSLMSTPILNAPQSGILGMHKIQERPMAVNGEMVIRPMMYLALSYDHRVVDGKGAVTFLVRVKECLEDPQRMVLDL
ncbi:MAG TPA: 2-oxoglutarate dehydrogenase complex dihydrolipoyllysine-residue succinyltransferase [Rhizobiales bacterium]|nr:dihydrolipoyllysine-residue succinyltransferase component of 2-oxoglutarate dehydrogenase complex [bacterium BMS3Bbin10]HDO51747.1 2-oxoglutarate dehydrogenase complex dihydrolipoyllysine-residue succinyltransferase [Hyphomicrobiales bacterium]